MRRPQDRLVLISYATFRYDIRRARDAEALRHRISRASLHYKFLAVESGRSR